MQAAHISFILLAMTSLALAGCTSSDVACHWAKFKLAYGRVYDASEEASRFEVFQNNLAKIESLNAAMPSAHFAINKFSDLSSEEFSAKYLSGLTGNFATNKTRRAAYSQRYVTADSLPASYVFPWVTPAKNQGGCGSCWAFAAIDVMEAQWLRRTGITEDMSEQQLVDCSSAGSCSGGSTWGAINYMISKPVMREVDYSYTAVDGTCKYQSSKALFKVLKTVTIGSEPEWQEMLYNTGPFAVYLNATHLQSYSSGIFHSNSDCMKTPNHALMLYGWGVSGSTPFWVIKNSWGSTWGESGSFRIVRNINACNLNLWQPDQLEIDLRTTSCFRNEHCNDDNDSTTDFCVDYSCVHHDVPQCKYSFTNPQIPTFSWSGTSTDVMLSGSNIIRMASGESLTSGCNGDSLKYQGSDGNWISGYTDVNGNYRSSINNFYASGNALYVRTLQSWQSNLPSLLNNRYVSLSVTCNNGVSSCLIFSLKSS